MNQKAYSVLFCALLASTFVHELRAKGVAPVSSRLGVFERAAPITEICTVECQFNVTQDFGLSIIVVGNIFVVVNASANVAILIDVSASIVVLLNGNTGGGVGIDLKAQTGIYFKSGLWVAANISIELYIKQVFSGGLKAIFSIAGGIAFKVATASSEVTCVINDIIVKLIINVGANIRQNAKLGLQIVIAISSSLIVLLNGSLRGLLTIIGVAVIRISSDLAGFLNLLQGFAIIVVQVSGSLQALIEAGVVFNLVAIFYAANGLEVLINIILQIGVVIDIGAKLGGILNNAESFFRLIAQLGGNLSIGLNGVFWVVANIVALINKNVTLEVVISVIIQVLVDSRQYVSVDLSAQFIALLDVFLVVVKRINATASLSGLIVIIQSLKDGKLVIGGVNISVIIEKLIVGIGSTSCILLDLLVFIVLQLQVIVEIGILVPYIALVLIFRLFTAVGVLQLIALGIKLELDIGSLLGNILGNILSGVVALILALLTGNFYDALTKLPVIGTILIALNASIQAASGGKFSLKALLNVSTLVQGFIKGLIQVVTGISLGVSAAIIAQVKAILEVTASASVFININITASANVTISG